MQFRVYSPLSEGHLVPKKRKYYIYRHTVMIGLMDLLPDNPFPAADKLAWLAQVRTELKDGNAEESLRWSTPDGFRLEPYYTADDLANLPLNTIQAAQKQYPGWINAPEYTLTNDPKADNNTLRDALARGADALLLTENANAAHTEKSVSLLLNGIKLSDTPVFLRMDTGSAQANSATQTAFIRILKTVAPYQLKGGLLTEPNEATADITRLTADSPQFRTVFIGSHTFHNAGATATQELGFSLAKLADTYDSLTDAGLTAGQLISKTILSVSTGTSYFMEIAKLRALRVVLARFLNYYDLPAGPSSVSAQPYIHCQTSTFYDAAITPYTNLLRATTEAMAAVVGGCDALTVHPYDAVLSTVTDREFSERIARNVSILLSDESYLGKVADPSAGSFYIENLTYELAEAAWSLFLDVENRGGYKRAFVDGFIRAEIDRAYQAQVDAVRAGRVLVGVTKFRTEDDSKPKSRVVGRSEKDGLGSLPDRRLAEEFE